MYINPMISKWGMFEQAKKLILQSRRCRQQFAIALKSRVPVNISRLNLPNQLIINKLSWFKTFSTVALKNFPYKLNPQDIYSDTLTYFKNRFFMFESGDEFTQFDKYAEDYLQNPKFQTEVHQFKEEL